MVPVVRVCSQYPGNNTYNPKAITMSARLSDGTEKPGSYSDTGAGKGLTPQTAPVLDTMDQAPLQEIEKIGDLAVRARSVDTGGRSVRASPCA